MRHEQLLGQYPTLDIVMPSDRPALSDMFRYQQSIRAFAVGLSAVAGYLDAIGYLSLGGFFVSFMSGNSTRLSVGLAHGAPDAAIAAGLIGSFLIGVILASLLGRGLSQHRSSAILGLVSCLLLSASVLAALGAKPATLALVAVAMGAKNTVFEREGEVSIGLTYMTGTLVKFGQRLAAALFTKSARLSWLPYLLLWLGLVAGAVVGTATYAQLGLRALWFAVGAELVLTGVSLRLSWRSDGGAAH